MALFAPLWGCTTWTGYFKCREVKTGFCRNRSMQTGSSGTLIGWKSGQTTFVPLLDRMEGAWLRTQVWCWPYCFSSTMERRVVRSNSQILQVYEIIIIRTATWDIPFLYLLLFRGQVLLTIQWREVNERRRRRWVQLRLPGKVWRRLRPRRSRRRPRRRIRWQVLIRQLCRVRFWAPVCIIFLFYY